MSLSRADIHIHTTCSDGGGSPLQVAHALVGSSLAVAAITDHDSVEGALRVQNALQGDGPEIVIGTEVTTADGHLLALFIEDDVPAGQSALETIERIHDQGGLAIAPHPYFPICSLGELAGRLALDAIEISNGTPLGEWANRSAARRLGASARALVGGSDAHVVSAVGHVRTLFRGHAARELRTAIECGQTRPAFDWKRHIEIAPGHLRRAAWLTLRSLLPATAAKGEKATLR